MGGGGRQMCTSESLGKGVRRGMGRGEERGHIYGSCVFISYVRWRCIFMRYLRMNTCFQYTFLYSVFCCTRY